MQKHPTEGYEYRKFILISKNTDKTYTHLLLTRDCENDGREAFTMTGNAVERNMAQWVGGQLMTYFN